MKTFILALSFVLVPTLSFARPADLQKYKEHYSDKAASANCNVCHGAKKTDLTDFGKAYKAAGKDFSKIKDQQPGKKAKAKSKRHHKNT